MQDSHFDRTSTWSEHDNERSYRQADGTTRKPSLPTTRISTRTSGEQLSRPFPPRLSLFSSPLLPNLLDGALVHDTGENTHEYGAPDRGFGNSHTMVQPTTESRAAGWKNNPGKSGLRNPPMKSRTPVTRHPQPLHHKESTVTDNNPTAASAFFTAI